MTVQSMFVTYAAALVLVAPVLAVAPEVAEASPGAADAAAAAAATDVVWDDSVYFGGTFLADAAHRTVLVWGTPDGTMTMRRQADSTWTQPKVISTDPAIDVSKMAADAAGNITAVWISKRQGFTDGVMASRMTAAGWSKPVRISRDLRVPGYPGDGKGSWGASELTLAVSPKGAAVVVWSWGSPARHQPYRVQSVYHGPGRGWTDVVDVTQAAGSHHPQVGIAADGTARLLYVHRPVGQPRSWLFRSRHPGQRWSDPNTVVRQADYASLAVDGAGDALVVYMPTWSDPVEAVYRRTGGRWGAPDRLSPGGGYSLAMNGHGTAVVALARAGHLVLLRHSPRGQWSAPTTLTPADGSYSGFVSVALDEKGDTSVAWGEETLYGRYQPAGGRWSNRYTIGEDPGGVIEGVSSRVAPNGDAVVIWGNENDAQRMRAMRTAP